MSDMYMSTVCALMVCLPVCLFVFLDEFSKKKNVHLDAFGHLRKQTWLSQKIHGFPSLKSSLQNRQVYLSSVVSIFFQPSEGTDVEVEEVEELVVELLLVVVLVKLVDDELVVEVP